MHDVHFTKKHDNIKTMLIKNLVNSKVSQKA